MAYNPITWLFWSHDIILLSIVTLLCLIDLPPCSMLVEFNTRPFKCYNFLADQTLAEIAIVGFLFDNKFKELVILKNLLAYLELPKSSKKVSSSKKYGLLEVVGLALWYKF